MRNGFNPTRRNRNIGTAKQGHGRNNRMTVPTICHYARNWWEQIDEYDVQKRRIQSRSVTFIIEKITQGFAHLCTVDDLCHILELVPSQDWEGLDAILFRQPTRREAMLKPVWGRLVHASDVGQPGKPTIYSGPLVILEAQELGKSLKWSKSLCHSDLQELDRLRAEGHVIQDCGKHFLITFDGRAARATQLFRTVLHEIGHWVDLLEKVERPAQIHSNKFENLIEAYWARPDEEREEFAHRYADRIQAKFKRERKIPFEPLKAEA